VMVGNASTLTGFYRLQWPVALSQVALMHNGRT